MKMLSLRIYPQSSCLIRPEVRIMSIFWDVFNFPSCVLRG